MTIAITLELVLYIVGFLIVNYFCFAAMAYCDIRYLKSDKEEYDDMSFAVPLLFGSVIFTCAIIIIGFSLLNKYIGVKLPSIKSITDLAKKHRAQDEDVTYQLEKHLLDKK